MGERGGLNVRMLEDSLRHRGPDGSGVWSDPNGRAALVHTRLAILDLSEAGAQPMGYTPGQSLDQIPISDPNSRYLLVFNGEIYNYQELKAELEADGETFLGHSDSEVLLRLLSRNGTDAIARLAGMFAFAFLDRATDSLLLVRDGFGIKPLYYAID